MDQLSADGFSSGFRASVSGCFVFAGQQLSIIVYLYMAK
jgi:hypothetical protein